MLSNKGLCLYSHRTRRLKISQCLCQQLPYQGQAILPVETVMGLESSGQLCGTGQVLGPLVLIVFTDWLTANWEGSMLPGFHKRLSIIKHYLFTPQDQALSLRPWSFICIRRQRRERKDGGSSGCALWLDIAVMPQAVFPLIQCHSRILSPWDHYPH